MKASLEFIPLEKGLKADRETATLYGVQVAMLGEAKGHGFELDDTTLNQIVALGNAKPNGVKTRFGHPTMCTPALGTFLGVRKNFVRDGAFVRADLHMSKAANKEKAQHVLDMAELEPHHIGNSMSFYMHEEYRLDEDGNRLKDEDGNELMPLVRMDSLEAVDVVDEPASGTGMFAEPVEGVELSARTIVELRNALDKPGFLDRALSFLGVRDEPEPITAGDASEEDVRMNLTLSELLENHPAVAAEHATKLTADKDKELAAAKDGAIAAERTRIASFLSQCQPCHFAKTAEHPKGFALFAIETGLSEIECLKGIIELGNKANALALLEAESSAIPVGSAPVQDKQLSASAVAELNLIEAAKKHNENMKGGA